MKKITITIIGILLSLSILAQVTPAGINYQAAARDNNGQIIANEDISVKFNIRQGDFDGAVVYSEEHFVTTNDHGLFNLVIGYGDYPSAVFNEIDWGADTYFSEVLIDVSGGASFVSVGTSQLMSVPYAMHAKTAESFTGNIEFDESDPIFIAHPVYNIESSDIVNWDMAQSWGDHSVAGYVSTETDPVFMMHAASLVTPTLMDMWSQAYGWGNHAGAGYLTEYSETDPVFTAHVAHAIEDLHVLQWKEAYQWGDHADAGYLKTGEIVVGASGFNAMVRTEDDMTVAGVQAAGAFGARFRAGTTGTYRAYVPVDIPFMFLDKKLHLENIEIFYRCNSASSYITQTWILDNHGGVHTQIAGTTANQTSTTMTSYNVSNAPYEMNGTLVIVLVFQFGGIAAPHDIIISNINATFSY